MAGRFSVSRAFVLVAISSLLGQRNDPVSRGIALRQNGDVIGAISEFQAAVQLNRDDAEAHYELGVTLGQQGSFEESKAALLRALELNSHHAEAHYHLG